MASKYFKTKPITIAEQIYHIRIKYSELITKIGTKYLDVNMKVYSNFDPNFYYKIKILQKRNEGVPEVYLIEPQNPPKYQNEEIPHNYGFKETQKGKGKKKRNNKFLKICSFMPREDWDSSMLIADTVVPWTVEWLMFYEIWLISGKWQGGGKHPIIRQ